MIRLGYTTTYQSWKTTVSNSVYPLYFLLKEALWQKVKVAMNYCKHNSTFHQGLRTFQTEKHYILEINKISKANKNADHNKTCLFCLLLEHFRNIHSNSVGSV